MSELSREPLYLQVATRLRREITRGDFTGAPHHGRLPSEADLMRQYNVARDTVRRAVGRLAAEGMVVDEHGRGTFVRIPPLQLLSSRYARGHRQPGIGPFELACQNAGIPGYTAMVSVREVPADDAVALGLGVEPGAPVVRRLRHMHAGDPDRIVQIQEGFLPVTLVAGTPLAEAGKISDGIYAALDAIGHPPVAATETVSARMPTPDEAALFGLKNGAPVVVIRRQTFDAAGQIVEWLRVVGPGESNEFVYERLPLI